MPNDLFLVDTSAWLLALRKDFIEYRQFVGVARGSAAEVGYQLLLARDLSYIDQDTCQTNQTNYDRICQMLTKLAKSLE